MDRLLPLLVHLRKYMRTEVNKMPVRKVKGGYQYGESGKIYKSKEDAEKQGKAIRASQAKKKKKEKKA